MPHEFRFTKQSIQKLPAPGVGKRIEYRDTETHGLRLRKSDTDATFYFFGRCRAVRGNIRVRIGRFPVLSVEEARRQATLLAADCARGENPADKVREKRTELTLSELFETYMTQHSRVHKRTASEDEDKFKRHIAKELGARPLSRISRRGVSALHVRLTQEAGPVTANRVHSLLLGVFNWGIRHDLALENPAKGVTRNREKSRARYVREDEMPYFLRAAEVEPSPAIGDLFRLCLFTGALVGNVRAMRWEEINLTPRNEAWAIPRTKNGHQHLVGLIPPAIGILTRRLVDRESEVFVFPGCGKTGHLAEPKKGWQRVTSRAES